MSGTEIVLLWRAVITSDAAAGYSDSDDAFRGNQQTLM